MLVTLTVVFCLKANSLSCVERSPLLEEPVTLATCPLAGQVFAAGYLAENPDMALSVIRCTIGNRRPSRDA